MRFKTEVPSDKEKQRRKDMKATAENLREYATGFSQQVEKLIAAAESDQSTLESRVMLSAMCKEIPLVVAAYMKNFE